MRKNLFICSTCGNTDPKYIGYRCGHPYCRKCISFRGAEVRDTLHYPKEADINIDYDLTEEQKNLSRQLLKNYKNGQDTLVYAVCGAGKTEIVLEIIKYAVNCGENVGFAVPRRDVVIELYDRFKKIFNHNKVVYMCGDHTDSPKGDLVILTTHQLYRYYKYFDLLIIDEIDAFPFKNNELLHTFFERACKKNYIMMSATPSIEILEEFERKGNVVSLFSRYHEYPLPVPEIKVSKGVIKYITIINVLSQFLKKTKPVFIFTPTIDKCEFLFKYLSFFFKHGMCIHSKKENRTKILNDFKNGKYKYLVTTAVLERGVTFKDLQVIIFEADHTIYDSYSLIQISGRVGRKKDAPEGRVIYIVDETNKEIERSINEIKRANKNLQNML